MHVARTLHERVDRRVFRLVAMAQHRDELAIVTMNRVHRLSRAIERLDRGRVVVEASQPGVGIALDVGRVRGGPVPARARVAKDVEGPAAKRIAPFGRIGTGARDRDPQGFVRRARRRDHARVVGRERQTLPVVDRSTREPPDEVEHSRVVLEAPAAVGV